MIDIHITYILLHKLAVQKCVRKIMMYCTCHSPGPEKWRLNKGWSKELGGWGNPWIGVLFCGEVDLCDGYVFLHATRMFNNINNRCDLPWLVSGNIVAMHEMMPNTRHDTQQFMGYRDKRFGMILEWYNSPMISQYGWNCESSVPKIVIHGKLIIFYN